MLRPRTLFALITLLVATSAQAWHATGHMVVADIAWRNMTPKAQAEAMRLVVIDAPAKSPDFFTAAVWADDTKTRENGPWHYIDLYFRADGKPTNLKPDAENVVWAIGKFSKTLSDKSASDKDRGQALRYLLHFVGDIHMPLHCSSRVTDANPKGDAGGNKFIAQDPSETVGRRGKNLHTIWDSGCGFFPELQRPLADESKTKLESLADACLAELNDADKSSAHSVTEPMAWANEGFHLAKDVVYTTPENKTPSKKYIETGQALCRKRVAIAGLRLADLLNRILG